ncbi:MAG: ADP-ribosylation factor-like protein [Promethearchaeota archaeon]
MVRITKNKDIYVKILYWGPASSGKTTAVDTMHRLTQEQNLDVTPTGQLTKIAMASGSTLYFDRGIFQSKKKSSIYFHVYTVAGQTRFSPLRKKIFVGTDGVVFVFDSQKARWADNVESLKELKKVAGGDLITKIPLLVMANKQDLPGVVRAPEIEALLKEEGLWYEPGDPMNMWNPIVYETVAIYDKQKEIYKVFSECARRTSLYAIYGKGSAPVQQRPVKLPDKVPDL